MLRHELERNMKWLEAAAKRAELPLGSVAELPEAASELVFWEHYLDQLNQLACTTKCPSVGLTLGCEVRYTEFGSHGNVLLNAADSIGHFLELACQMNNVRVSVSHIEYKRFKRYGRIYFRPVEALPLCPVEVDVFFATVVQFLRNYLGTRWRPDRASLRRSAPEDVAPYQEVLGDNVRFSHKSDHFDIDASLLDIPVNETDPILHQSMRSHADVLIKNASMNKRDVSAQVKFLLLESLGARQITQELVADRLNMSRTTLQRRLEAEGTNYRILRSAVVGHLAKKYLKESSLPVSTIADRLGYSEHASFTRAFAATEGVSPRTYRRQSSEKEARQP